MVLHHELANRYLALDGTLSWSAVSLMHPKLRMDLEMHYSCYYIMLEEVYLVISGW